MTFAGLIRPSFRSRRRLRKAIAWGCACAILLMLVCPRTTMEEGVEGLMSGEVDDVQGSWFGNKDECKGWDPEGAVEDDPSGCLKARQYRQVQRVLAREIEAKHETWWFTAAHNIPTLESLLHCFLPPTHANFTACPPKPLILSGWWYTAEVITKATSGEVIWQTALTEMASELGINYVAFGPYENWVTVAEMMPDVYRLLWVDAQTAVACTTDPRCVAAGQYVVPEDGEDLSVGVPEEELGVIPIWAINVVDWWGAVPKENSHNAYWWGLSEEGDWSFHPLGQEWTATPWPLPGGHVHLPYSIESHCSQLPVKPYEEREDKVLIFAKRSTYFGYDGMPPKAFWSELSAEPDFELLTTAKEDEGHSLPDGLTRLGGQTREAYDELVGNVKAIVGMGFPIISPSAYTALCRGTPLVLPYFRENASMEGWRLYGFDFQHGPAMTIGEPYVYSYHAQNYTQLRDAVHRAFNTPIQRYIPPDMKLEFCLDKFRMYLGRNLEGMYRTVLRRNGGKIPRLGKGIRERCTELKRCPAALPAGRRPYRPEL